MKPVATVQSSSNTQAPRHTDRVLEALSTLAALLDRTINEVKSLDPEFQKSLLQAVQDKETSVQKQATQHLERTLTQTRSKLEEEFSERINDLSSKWDEERNYLNAELGKMAQSAAQWEAERARLNGELERLARVQAATQAEAEKAIIAMKAASAAAKTAKAESVKTETLTAEIHRVEGLIKAVSQLIEDPSTELSSVIRKNVERAELESYVKGIQFALNDFRSK